MIQLTVGPNVSHDQAQVNRQNIEIELTTTGVALLPQGEIMLDQAVTFDSRHRIVGAGKANTILRNGFTRAPYGPNNTLQSAWPAVNGYAIAGVAKKNTFTTSELIPTDAVACYTWRYSSFSNATTRRHRIVSRKGNIIVIDPPPDPAATAVLWVYPMPPGYTGWARYTNGPSVANELFGETRYVVGGLPVRPIRRPLAGGEWVRIGIVQDARIENLTIGQPTNVDASSLFAAYTSGLTLSNVRVEGEGLGTALSSNVRLLGCESTSTIGFNATEDSLVQDCQCREVYFEEGCVDIDLVGVRVVGGGIHLNGISSNTSCERLRLSGCRVEGAVNMPVALGGIELRISDLIIANSVPGDPISYLSGDRLQVSGLLSDKPVSVAGREIQVLNVHSPKTFFGWYGILTTGMATNVANIDRSHEDG